MSVAFIVYADKAARDAINEKVMTDPRLKDMGSDSAPFDDRRMAYAGFETLVAWS